MKGRTEGLRKEGRKDIMIDSFTLIKKCIFEKI
jgi:hypothetical protein